MSRKLLAILIVSLFSACAFPICASADISTSNAYVGATVTDGWGLVTWYKKPTSTSLQRDWKILTFVNHSFLNLRINSLYYTNNNLSPPPTLIGPPQIDSKTNPDVFLDNGANQKIGDTIITTWRQDSFDIVQFVYPVAFTHSGQIVVKWKIVNHSNAGVNAIETNFLLDVDPQSDKAKVLTRYGYSPKWRVFPDPRPVPPFFMAFEHAPGDAGFPGLTGTGYVNDTMAPTPLGLISPAKLIIGEWTSLSFFKFGYDGPIGQDYGDNAILYMWPMTGAPVKTPTDSVTMLASVSYGLGEFCDNYGSSVPVYAMLMRPGQLSYDPRTKIFSPNPFTVEAIVFNLSSTTPLSNASATLTIQKPLQFTSGTALYQTHTLSPGSIEPFNVGDATWIIKLKDTAYAVDVLAPFALDINGIGWTDPWDCPIRIPSVNADTLPPIITGGSGSQHSFTMQVHDDRVSDSGLKNISFIGDSSVFKVAIGGSLPIVGCPKTVYTVTVTVFDSVPWKPGSQPSTRDLELRFTDCANNVSVFDTAVSVVPAAHDINAPTFTYRFGSKLNHATDSNNHCNFQCTEWSLLDNKQFDRGLASVTQKQFDNMSLNIDGLSPDGKAISFSICAVDTTKNGSMTLEAIDSAGHVVDTSFTYCAASTAGVGSSALSDLSLRVYPNPTTGACTLTLNGTATIEVLDVLGRTVDRFTMTDMREWDMSALPAGTYIVRADINDAHVSTRILKQ